MIGILVCGDNHFIVRGPPPDRAAALALARHWSIIQIGQATPPSLRNWSIVTRAFRENLEWAVLVPGDGADWRSRAASLFHLYVFPQLVRTDVRRVNSPFVIGHDS
jgi:hypothetical protein